MPRLLLLACASLMLSTLPARADAIYGGWCSETERLVVEYTKVITPGGASPSAEIDRHSAVYIAPGGERDAGKRLVFRQLNDNAVERRAFAAGAEVGSPEIWTPCSEPPKGLTS